MNVDNSSAYKHSASELPEAKPCQNQSERFACKTLKKIRKDLFEKNLPVSQNDIKIKTTTFPSCPQNIRIISAYY